MILRDHTTILLSDQLNRKASELNFTEWDASWENMTDPPTLSPTASPTESPSGSPSEEPTMLPTITPTEYHIRERPPVDVPVYVAIASVPRKNDIDYLIKVLDSLVWAQFPLENVYVFFNGNRTQTHYRWNEAFYLYSNLGIHFLWNEMPEPPIHPAVFNSSLPMPDNISMEDEEVALAMTDSDTRKRWRHKECNDFRAISKHMLSVVAKSRHDNGGDPGNDPWVIFNQDDGQWVTEFQKIFRMLMEYRDLVDFHGEGMVSIGFQSGRLAQLVEYGKKWCDFKPVDWMMWEFTRINNLELVKLRKYVAHIGKISSREGRVSDPPTYEPTRAPSPTHAVPAPGAADPEQMRQIRSYLTKNEHITNWNRPFEARADDNGNIIWARFTDIPPAPTPAPVAQPVEEVPAEVGSSVIESLIGHFHKRNKTKTTFYQLGVPYKAYLLSNGTVSVFKNADHTGHHPSHSSPTPPAGHALWGIVQPPTAYAVNEPGAATPEQMEQIRAYLAKTSDGAIWNRPFEARAGADGNIMSAKFTDIPEAPTEFLQPVRAVPAEVSDDLLERIVGYFHKRNATHAAFSQKGAPYDADLLTNGTVVVYKYTDLEGHQPSHSPPTQAPGNDLWGTMPPPPTYSRVATPEQVEQIRAYLVKTENPTDWNRPFEARADDDGNIMWARFTDIPAPPTAPPVTPQVSLVPADVGSSVLGSLVKHFHKHNTTRTTFYQSSMPYKARLLTNGTVLVYKFIDTEGHQPSRSPPAPAPGHTLSGIILPPASTNSEIPAALMPSDSQLFQIYKQMDRTQAVHLTFGFSTGALFEATKHEDGTKTLALLRAPHSFQTDAPIEQRDEPTDDRLWFPRFAPIPASLHRDEIALPFKLSAEQRIEVEGYFHKIHSMDATFWGRLGQRYSAHMSQGGHITMGILVKKDAGGDDDDGDRDSDRESDGDNDGDDDDSQDDDNDDKNDNNDGQQRKHPEAGDDDDDNDDGFQLQQTRAEARGPLGFSNSIAHVHDARENRKDDGNDDLMESIEASHGEAHSVLVSDADVHAPQAREDHKDDGNDDLMESLAAATGEMIEKPEDEAALHDWHLAPQNHSLVSFSTPSAEQTGRSGLRGGAPLAQNSPDTFVAANKSHRISNTDQSPKVDTPKQNAAAELYERHAQNTTVTDSPSLHVSHITASFNNTEELINARRSQWASFSTPSEKSKVAVDSAVDDFNAQNELLVSNKGEDISFLSLEGVQKDAKNEAEIDSSQLEPLPAEGQVISEDNSALSGRKNEALARTGGEHASFLPPNDILEVENHAHNASVIDSSSLHVSRITASFNNTSELINARHNQWASFSTPSEKPKVTSEGAADDVNAQNELLVQNIDEDISFLALEGVQKDAKNEEEIDSSQLELVPAEDQVASEDNNALSGSKNEALARTDVILEVEKSNAVEDTSNSEPVPAEEKAFRSDLKHPDVFNQTNNTSDVVEGVVTNPPAYHEASIQLGKLAASARNRTMEFFEHYSEHGAVTGSSADHLNYTHQPKVDEEGDEEELIFEDIQR